jgi:phosphoglycerol transferase MdoB-like AlkP superfamily enzyme
MPILKRSGIFACALLLFWLLIFDIQRITFSFHNWEKLSSIGFGEWLLAFVHSIRLDLAMGAFLSILPLILIICWLGTGLKWLRFAFVGVLFLELVICCAIHAGEVNAYTEWNHKLTTRVFTHLLNPDEVVRTADGGMTIWFIIYFIIELLLGYLLFRWLLPTPDQYVSKNTRWFVRLPVGLFSGAALSGSLLVLGRGGIQPIPINIDAAYYSKDYVANDLSVNSVYFFMKSFLLYNKSEIGAMFPMIPEAQARKELKDFFHYPQKHDNYILETERPNIVVIVLESWTAHGVGCITGKKGATPYFDKLSKEGLLFTRFYATGGTSEVGNSSLFSGYPALPEISISMQPDKHRKLPSFNKDLKKWGYTSHYLFSGDLKYGNIGGYFMDHGFDVVEDENNFPSSLKRGKLNYYDEDLYKLLIKKIDHTKGPFLHCAFTGSTHSPYDFPNRGTQRWRGSEAQFMSSLFYADHCLHRFIKACKKKKWYKNTLFVFVADHGHASPEVKNPNLGAYYHIPLLIYGEPLKKEWKGKRVEKIGSQADLVRTLLYQMGGDFQRYTWGKDLLNPQAPEFALHTINRGFGWITPQGNFSYHMDTKQFMDNNMPESALQKARKRCHSYLSLNYYEYKDL